MEPSTMPASPLQESTRGRAEGCPFPTGTERQSARSGPVPIRPAHAFTLAVALLLLASCERTPSKADYVDDRVAAECAERTGDAFTLCRLEVIKKYVSVPLAELQAKFPAPEFEDRLGCS